MLRARNQFQMVVKSVILGNVMAGVVVTTVVVLAASTCLAFVAENKVLSPVEARKKVGETITVEMTVRAAKDRLEKRGEIYLDAETDFKNEKNFAVVITRAGAASLKEVGIDNPAEHFKDKKIRATGTVKEVDQVPRIEIDDAKQISPLTLRGEPPPITMKGAELFLAADVKWQDAPASLPKGAKIALLEGDPAREGSFVIRIKFTDGCRIMPHTHPRRERVTVLSGTLNIGMGGKFDDKAGRAMPAGTYGSWPEGMKHFGWATGETVIQLHGMGPWVIQYVNPDDDPRNKK